VLAALAVVLLAALAVAVMTVVVLAALAFVVLATRVVSLRLGISSVHGNLGLYCGDRVYPKPAASCGLM